MKPRKTRTTRNQNRSESMPDSSNGKTPLSTQFVILPRIWRSSRFELPLTVLNHCAVDRGGGRPACRRAGHLARRIVVRVSPSVRRSAVPFRAARCRQHAEPIPDPSNEGNWRIASWTLDVASWMLDVGSWMFDVLPDAATVWRRAEPTPDPSKEGNSTCSGARFKIRSRNS